MYFVRVFLKLHFENSCADNLWMVTWSKVVSLREEEIFLVTLPEQVFAATLTISDFGKSVFVEMLHSHSQWCCAASAYSSFWSPDCDVLAAGIVLYLHCIFCCICFVFLLCLRCIFCICIVSLLYFYGICTVFVVSDQRTAMLWLLECHQSDCLSQSSVLSVQSTAHTEQWMQRISIHLSAYPSTRVA